MSVERSPAIEWIARGDDGPSFGWEGAKIQCPECDGWKALACPHGCGVRLVSTKAEDDAAYRERMAREREERDVRRAQRRAERAIPPKSENQRSGS